jgi:serine/threonine protein kinase
MLESDDLLPGAPSLTREDPSAFSPPPAFGPFRVLHQIGVGALGPVFRTYEPTRDRLVAVKVFRLDIVPEQAQSLADELSRATEAGLFHPSIVEPIAAGVEGTLAYRAEEYVAAESLDVAMRHYAPASTDKALPFITQLAGAIDFARTTGVKHGGLHPRDIFVTPDDARATGFGVVEALERAGIRAPVRRPYAAPERIAASQWGTPADVFSLAAIAFELLTGRRPAGTGAQIGALNPEAGPHANALHGVLARAMDEDPARRYPTALAFAAALEAAARGAVATPVVVPIQPPVAEPSSAKPQPVVEKPPEKPQPVVEKAAEKPQPVAEKPPEKPRPVADKPPAPIRPVAEEIKGDRPTDRAAAAATTSLFDIEEPASSAVVHGEPALSADTGVDELDEADTLVADRLASATSGRLDAHESAADVPPPLEAAYQPPAESTRYAPEEERYEARGLMFGADSEAPDVSERSRPAVLPLAVTLVLGLLAGFAAGYFVGDRDHAASPPATEAAQARSTPSPPSNPSARQYSDQAVTSAPSPPGPAPATPPPTVSEEASSPSRAATGAPSAAAPPRTSAAAATGRLVVQSTPPRASVSVNGRWSGRTPLTLDKLPFGRYVVRVVQPGYRVEQNEVALSARNSARTINLRLSREKAAAPPRATAPSRPTASESTQSPENFTGMLFVDSRPQGANVLLDGKVVGKTPLRLPDVPVGAHVVRIELAEHRPWSSVARITAGQESRVTGSLERFQ